MKIIAHRSGPVTYPEQTIQSAREALSLGADIVEIDVRYTADKQIAICHDANAMRVFGVDKNVAEMTAVEFRSLRHAKDASFGSHLFEDYLKCGIAPLLIHIKEAAVIGDLLTMIDAYGYADKVIMGVASVESAKQVRDHNSSIQILSFAGESLIDDFIDFGPDYIRLWEDWLTQELVDKIQKSSSKLWVMSGYSKGLPKVGEPTTEGLKTILSYKPNGILINDVRQLTALLGKA